MFRFHSGIWGNMKVWALGSGIYVWELVFLGAGLGLRGVELSD